MNKANITILCCYNNLEQYEKMVESLNNQTKKPLVIPIDNRKQKYTSCSSAFNSELINVKTKYVLFCHQDILFQNKNMIEDFEKYFEKLEEGDILGVAGVVGIKETRRVITNIKHGEQFKFAGNERIVGLLECETVDECCFGGYTKNFLQNKFNENLCDNWHFYAVERCLNALTKGKKVYVCDIPLIHVSRGVINHNYNRNLYKISKYYNKNFNYIATTCGSWKTGFWWRKYIFIRRTIAVILRKRKK